MERQLTDDYERVLLRRHEHRIAEPLGARSRRAPIPLGYLPLRERPLRRLTQLFTGLALYGFGLSLTVRADLGVNPWSVLYEGLERHTPLSFGTISALVGVLVLLAWIPLRQRPALGTLANIAVLAVTSDLGLHLVPAGLGPAARAGLLAGGILLGGLATAVYVGARLGPGPRDGLMTGTSAATGRSLRRVRTLIELTVLAVGWSLGGTVGIGTLLHALSVGPLVQSLLPRFTHRSPTDPPPYARTAPEHTAAEASARSSAPGSVGRRAAPSERAHTSDCLYTQVYEQRLGD